MCLPRRSRWKFLGYTILLQLLVASPFLQFSWERLVIAPIQISLGILRPPASVLLSNMYQWHWMCCKSDVVARWWLGGLHKGYLCSRQPGRMPL